MSETQPTFAPELSAAPPLPAREEYLERQDRARAALVEAELDGLLAFGSRNWPWAVRWLADYQSGFQQQGPSPTFGDKSFSALVLPVDGPPILILDQRTMPGECAVDDARTVERITGGVATALPTRAWSARRSGSRGRA